jgi:4'-phosphopantetheinyl transferase EntD
LATRILTPLELAGIDALDPHAHRQATLLYFALKEAVYKAIDPYVERYVRFTEVEVELDLGGLQEAEASGTATVALRLPECERMPLTVHAAWMLEPSWIVTTALGRRG